jgi:glycolate oxidase
MPQKRIGVDNKIIEEILRIVGKEDGLTSPEERRCYSYDARTGGATPDLVVFPSSPQEVSQILVLANKHGFPVIPRGQGSGLTGGSVPINGGVVMTFTKMNKILEIDTKNLVAVVEPGVITFVFQEEVAKYGLFYPPDPASYKYSSIGGNVAECSGGPNSMKYGVTRDYVLGLEVVKPTGEIITTGVKTMKGVVGYDLTRLFVGSEGTLGVITKIFLKLIPAPEAKATILSLFKKVEDTAEAVSGIVAAKIVPSTIEFMDRASIRCSEQASPMGIPEDIEGLLLIEIDGNADSIQALAEKIKAVLIDHNAAEVKLTRDQDEADKLWQARRVVSQATYNLNPVKIAEDVVVPRSNIPRLIRFLEETGKKHGIPILSFGHAGDGNFHVSLMIKDTDEDYAKAHRAVEEVFTETIRLGGTLSGEHGIGTAKAPYIAMELAPEVIETMRGIKRLFDPNNVLNPGKIFIDH